MNPFDYTTFKFKMQLQGANYAQLHKFNAQISSQMKSIAYSNNL